MLDEDLASDAVLRALLMAEYSIVLDDDDLLVQAGQTVDLDIRQIFLDPSLAGFAAWRLPHAWIPPLSKNALKRWRKQNIAPLA